MQDGNLNVRIDVNALLYTEFFKENKGKEGKNERRQEKRGGGRRKRQGRDKRKREGGGRREHTGWGGGKKERRDREHDFIYLKTVNLFKNTDSILTLVLPSVCFYFRDADLITQHDLLRHIPKDISDNNVKRFKID